jgi:peptide-methionine (R)-S-oxide reductase
MDKKYTEKLIEELKEQLTKDQYKVAAENSIEEASNKKYSSFFERGIYVDVTTGEPLFLSSSKFRSGCGWPAFSNPVKKEAIKEKLDESHGIVRTEVRSNIGDTHLGHVFNDGPKETGGLRYRINSATIKFISIDKMKELGYEEYLDQIAL